MLQGWGRTVITGRARLGGARAGCVESGESKPCTDMLDVFFVGIPMGVIAVGKPRLMVSYHPEMVLVRNQTFQKSSNKLPLQGRSQIPQIPSKKNTTATSLCLEGSAEEPTPQVFFKAHLRDPNPSKDPPCQVETRSVDRLVPADPSNSESCEVPVETQQPWLKKVMTLGWFGVGL